jgi:hypothetical protein
MTYVSCLIIELTSLQWLNSIDDICANQTQFCGYLKQFFEMQLDWMYEQIDSYPEDEYWHQVKLIFDDTDVSSSALDGFSICLGQSTSDAIERID